MWFRRETSSTDLLHVCPLRPPVNLGDFFFLFDLLLWFVRACSYIIQVSQRWESFFFPQKNHVHTRQTTRTMAAVERIIFKTGKEPVLVPADVFPIYLRAIIIIIIIIVQDSLCIPSHVTCTCHTVGQTHSSKSNRQQPFLFFKAQFAALCVGNSVHLRLWERYDAPAIWSKSFFSPFFPFLRLNSQSKLLTICLINVPIVFEELKTKFQKVKQRQSYTI